MLEGLLDPPMVKSIKYEMNILKLKYSKKR